MSLVEWNNRVAEAEAELRCVVDERETIERSVEAKEAAIRKHKDHVRKDKAALTKKLQGLERDALELAERTETATKARDAAESDYRDAMNAYESLHDAVKRIKATEAAIASRPNLEQQLETESIQWAEEEHRLRSVLQQREDSYKATRREGRERVAKLEAQLQELEAQLERERAERRAEGWGEGDFEDRQEENSVDEQQFIRGEVDARTEHLREVGSLQRKGSTSKEAGLARKRPASPLRDRTNLQ